VIIISVSGFEAMSITKILPCCSSI